jgi:pilus assembly protein Flp/PilA
MLKLLRNRKGQGLVEYALIIAGVTLLCAVGISLFGHKVAGMIDMVAVVLPGAHDECNGPIANGQLIETKKGTDGTIALDEGTIKGSTAARLPENLWGTGAASWGEDLVPDPTGAP